jgi:hypothetical protein
MFSISLTHPLDTFLGSLEDDTKCRGSFYVMPFLGLNPEEELP